MTDSGFVWHELMATDVTRAQVFLGELFGWDCRDGMLRAGERLIGAVLPFEGAPGFGSHWVPYVAVRDLDAFCDRVKACGGDLCIPPVAHPGGGRFAFLGDPQRGFFSAREGGDAAARTGTPGSFWLDKLLADDPAIAAKFYADLLGWSSPDEHGWMRGGEDPVAWIIRRPPVAPTPMWLPHVIVDDVAAAAARAKRLGAIVVVPPRQLAGIGTYAVFTDAVTGTIAAITLEARHAA
jgi:uncharacterized protein